MARIEMSDVQRAEMAARSGAPDALFHLGLIYSTGRDRSPDLVDAHKWFNLAALQGNGAAREYRADLAQEMTVDEVSEAQRRAREWLQAS